VERQVPIAIVYEGLRFEEGFRADIIVEGKVILELKSVEQIGKVHAKQVVTYLKLTGQKLGFVLNFGAKLMKDGIERVVNGLSEENLGVFASLRETKVSSESGRREGCPSRLPHHRTCGSAYGGSWQSLRTQQPLFLCHADRCPDAQPVGFIAPGQDQRWSCSACQVQPFPSCESVRVFPARCSRYYGLC